MIDQFRILCRVKGLQVQEGQNALSRKRAAIEAAFAEERAKSKVVTESRSKLAAKEKELYATIMHTTVSVRDIDETKASITLLEKQLQCEEDQAERLTQFRIQREQEFEEARVEYQKAQQKLEMFTKVRSDWETLLLLEVDEKEDAEIQDVFSTKQRVAR